MKLWEIEKRPTSYAIYKTTNFEKSFPCFQTGFLNSFFQCDLRFGARRSQVKICKTLQYVYMKGIKISLKV